eukprot:XP_001707285.1 Hypothetical protein GL50803_94632 [Giardia lamblia ATCC 50803]
MQQRVQPRHQWNLLCEYGCQALHGRHRWHLCGCHRRCRRPRRIPLLVVHLPGEGVSGIHLGSKRVIDGSRRVLPQDGLSRYGSQFT